jgi:glycosyltransferase involved in cell wall biosynthesis
MPPIAADRLERLGAELGRVRGDRALPPDASVAIPVNAQADLENVLVILGDIARYGGKQTFEVVLVINNYPADDPPEEIAAYAAAGIHVVSVPNAWRAGEAVCLSARVPGIRAAEAERILLFDADCRIPDPTLVLDWYVDQFRSGAQVAYTRVGHYDLRPLWSVRARMGAHHFSRWVKRVLLRIPTTRGSNYGVDRTAFMRVYEGGLLADDLNVGPAVKAAGGRVVYAGAPRLQVLTSGRKFRGGWRKLARYLRYRLLYNVRVLRTQAGKRTQKPYHQKPLR